MSVFSRLLLERCVRAGVAAATAAIGIQLTTGDLHLTTLRTLGLAAGAAFVSAVLSVISQAVGDPASTSFTQTTVDR